ncbi:tripartite tricarboxylate transporter substrate binding protein [Ramlibacter terrae]|uniref:Tripartite tricarboxylate transporter substrate binding protein n=1 Tax=Ramlibacter terrae TaxID=2732511 RepID=A0ABX6NZL1_9BURK|nr:tripartite tricarboxylate transporter substrate binding protein [Ramlibacter terrae]
MFDKLFRNLCALTALALAAGAASAQARPAATAFPTKPVKIIVAAAAGSSPDAIGRRLATGLGAAWNQPVLIENVAGLGGITGTDRAAKQPPDGYTFVVSTIGAMSVSGSLMQMPYDPDKDLAPVSLLMSMPNLLVVHPSVPVTSVKELVAYVKQNPGKLRYGHPGTGTSNHLSGELLQMMAGIKMQGVPYKSSAQMMTDLLAGHYEVLFHNSSVVLPHADAGKAKVLGITALERSPALPQVPTVADAGGIPGFAVSAWWGLYAPAGTPPDIIAKVSADVAAVLAQPENKSWVEKQAGTVGGGTPAQLGAFRAAETKKWRELIKSANIKAE